MESVPATTWGDHRRRALLADPRNQFLVRDLPLLVRIVDLLDAVQDEAASLHSRTETAAHAGEALDEFAAAQGADEVRDRAELLGEIEVYERIVNVHLMETLAQAPVRVLPFDELEPAQRKKAHGVYRREIFPLVMPQTWDAARPFPFLADLSLNLLVELQGPGDDAPMLARAEVPVPCAGRRFVHLEDESLFIPIESIMASDLDALFPDATIRESSLFRITRGALNGEAVDPDARDRRSGRIVRFEVSSDMTEPTRGMLASGLGLTEEAIVEAGALLGTRDLLEVASAMKPASPG